jgi:outer membrane receptor protein involved in Fe transport
MRPFLFKSLNPLANRPAQRSTKYGKTRRLWQPIIIALLIICPTIAWAITGTIEGVVIDEKTGEPLSSANITVKGTFKGGATDLDGKFSILGLSPGSYDLQCTILGYTEQLHTGINVRGGIVTRVEFKMTPTILAAGEEVIIVGERPLVETDRTSSGVRISSDDIATAQVEDVKDIVKEQMGVVSDDNEIHIRGGRSDESLTIVDGIRVRDPISGTGYGTYLSADAIKEVEVITGGFNAEYGQAMSGVVNVVTKEGSDKYEGAVTIKSDHLASAEFEGYKTNVAEVNFGGPEPLTTLALHKGLGLPGRGYFFINGYGYISNTYLPHASSLAPVQSSYDLFAPGEENNWSFLGKVRWEFDPKRKLSFNYGRSLQINQGYFEPLLEDKEFFPFAYINILDHYNTFTRESIQTSIHWKHTLSQKTYYEAIFARFFIRVHSAVDNKNWTDYVEHQDTDPIIYVSDQLGNLTIRQGDGFWDSGDAETWHDHFSDTYSLESNLTCRLNDMHQIKAGWNGEYTELQLIHINAPWVGTSGLGRNWDMYHVYPNAGAAYVQDQIRYKGMIANVGARFDYWFPGKYVEDVIADPTVATLSDEARRKFHDDTFGVFGHRGKGHLSPRIGISHPVTDRDMLFFSYGHFSQRPKYSYVYAHLRSQSAATYQLFGNPNLNPSITVAYELGLKHRFSENQVLEATAFYKDLFDYPTSQDISWDNPRYGNISYFMYFNQDYARARGVELRMKQRSARYLTGSLEFTYSIVSGKSSSSNTNLLVAAGEIQEKTLGEEYMKWDRPIIAALTLNFYRSPDDPRPWGIPFPKDMGIRSRTEFQSGKRYTPLIRLANGAQVYDEERYSALTSSIVTWDVNIYKNFQVGRIRLRWFLEIENLLNDRTPNIINPLTGRAYEPGDVIPITWQDTPQDLPPDDPSRLGWPRTILSGITIGF